MSVYMEHQVPAVTEVVAAQVNEEVAATEQVGAPAQVKEADVVSAGIAAALHNSMNGRW